MNKVMWMVVLMGICLGTCQFAGAFQSGEVPAADDSAPAERPQRLFTRLTGFGIPFNVDAADPSLIEIQLYLSSDGGRNWQLYSRSNTEGREFSFQANREGEYWFALRTLDRNRRLLPESDLSPELRIVIDTTRPRLDFRVETDAAGRVVCRWDARDDYLDPGSFRISYRSNDDLATEWQSVPALPGATARNGIYSDQVGWWPENQSASLRVRAQISDLAGNLVYEDRIVSVPQVAWRQRNVATASRPGWSQVQPYPQTDFPPLNPDSAAADPLTARPADGSPAVGPQQEVVCKDGICRVVPPTGPAEIHRANTGSHKLPAQLPSSRSSRPPIQRLVGSADEFAVPPMPTELAAAGGTARTVTPQTRSPESGGVQQRPNSALPDQLRTVDWPSQQKVNTPAETRKSEPTNIGVGTTLGRNWVPPTPNPYPTTPNAAFKVPVPVSADDGGTRQPAEPSGLRSPVAGESAGFQFENESGLAPDPRSIVERGIDPANIQHLNTRRFRLNYGIDSVDPSGVQKVELWITRDRGATWRNWATDPDAQSPFPVEVDQEGLFGFRIVVYSNDGLSGQPPSRGDEPDLWAQVDLTPPAVRVVSAPYGRGEEAGRLVINWQAEDVELSLRPVSLAFSTAASGPWTTIERGLRNSGRFVWKVPASAPDRIFLRLEARDKAGNTGIHQLPNPIDISGLVPRGRIHGVEKVGQ